MIARLRKENSILSCCESFRCPAVRPALRVWLARVLRRILSNSLETRCRMALPSDSAARGSMPRSAVLNRRVPRRTGRPVVGRFAGQRGAHRHRGRFFWRVREAPAPCGRRKTAVADRCSCLVWWNSVYLTVRPGASRWTKPNSPLCPPPLLWRFSHPIPSHVGLMRCPCAIAAGALPSWTRTVAASARNVCLPGQGQGRGRGEANKGLPPARGVADAFGLRNIVSAAGRPA
jgi:hypothetical protein